MMTAKPGQFDIQAIEEPYDEHEKELLGTIEQIKRQYQLAIEPYVKLLAESRSYKMPKYIVIPKLNDTSDGANK